MNRISGVACPLAKNTDSFRKYAVSKRCFFFSNLEQALYINVHTIIVMCRFRHTHTHTHTHTHARTHTDWLVPFAVTLGSYFSHCFHKASCTSIYTLHICHTRTHTHTHTNTHTHTQTARTQTNTHKHTHAHTNTHTDCMACTTCSNFGFLFLHCFHKVYMYINIHTCLHTCIVM